MKQNSAPLPTHEGLTWKDMPGGDTQFKKMNFSLFKRGHLSRAYVTASHRQQAKMAVNLGSVFKRRRAAK